MSESRESPVIDNDNDMSEVVDLEEESREDDTKEIILRRLSKALRLAGKLKTKLEFEQEVNKELARRNEQLKKDIAAQDEVYDVLKESFEDIYIQFDDLLVRYDEVLNVERPEKGSDAFLEASRDYDEKMEFLQKIRSRSGVDKTNPRNKTCGYGGSNDPLEDEEQNLNLVRMSGSSFFRKSMNIEKKQEDSVSTNEDTFDENSMNNKEKTGSEKKSRSFTNRMSISNTLGSIQKIVSPRASTTNDIATPTNQQSNVSPESKPPTVKDVATISEKLPPQAQPQEDSFTSTPLFEHFLVIGVPIAPAAELADQIHRKSESLSGRLMNQMGSFWKRSISSSNIGNKTPEIPSPVKRSSSTSAAASESPTSSPKKSNALSGRWGELSKNLKAAGNQGSGGIFDMNILSLSNNSATKNKSPVTPTEKAASMRSEQVSANINSTPDTVEPVSVPIASSRNANVSYTDPAVLYRYPPDADPPPPEVCDFCLPSGGRLRHLTTPSDREQTMLELLYGQGHTQRSSRCFIFMLEDKTLDISKNVPDEETGENTGRLFGICVVNPRLLNPYAPANKYRKSTTSSAVPNIEFEAAVCYCFITRFPLFDFFFEVLWNIMAFERVSRMMDVAEQSADASEIDLYHYIPRNIYEYVMKLLTVINPPRFGDEISLNIDYSLPPVNYHRSKPEGVYPEYFQMSAEWALPPLLHWLSAKTIVWALSLLLSEVKLIIIGKDAATVSCAVIGLTALIRPFQWVSPMIPILPIKHLDFIESPVPIIAGIVLDNDSPTATAFRGNAITPLNILRQCDDGDDVTAVLDLADRDLFTLSGYKKDMVDVLLPGAQSLIEKIENIISLSNVDKIECNVASRPPYKITSVHINNYKHIQSCVFNHMTTVGVEAKVKAKEALDGQVKEAEQKVKAQLEHLSSLKGTGQRKSSIQLSSIGTISEEIEGDEDGSNDSSNGNNSIEELNELANASTDSGIVGSGYTIPILSLSNMDFPDILPSHITKFYDRFILTQTYAEYDIEFEKLMHSVEAAVTGDNNEPDDTIIITSSRTKRTSGKRSSRKSLLLGGAVVNHEAKKVRGRSLYIKPSDSIADEQQSSMDKELRRAQEVAIKSIAADDKSSLRSQSTGMKSHKAYRRSSRAQSDGSSEHLMKAQSK